MNYRDKSKDQLIDEIELLKKKLSKIENSRIEENLLLQEEKFQILADQSPNMIFINLKGKIIFANKKCEEIMGYKKVELYADDFNFLVLITPKFRELVKTSFEKHLKGEEVDTYECTLLTKDNNEINVIITTKLIDVGCEIAILGIVTDITARKQSEQALKESEKRYQKLLELSFEGNAIHQDGKVVHINQMGAKLLGADKCDQLIGKRIFDFLHPDYIEIVKERINKNDEHGVEVIDEKFIRLDGKSIDVEVAGIPIQYKNKPARQVVFRDISKRKKMEESLRQSKELFEAIVKTSPDAVTTTDLNGIITNVSQKTVKMHGYKNEEEMIGLSAFDLLVPEDKKKARLNMQMTLEQGSISNVVYKMVKKDNSTFLAELNASAIKDSNGNPSSFIAILRDITDRKKFENALKERETNFRTLAENVNDAIFIADTTGLIVYVNKRASELTEYSSKELLSLYVEDLAHPEEYNKVINRLRRRTAGKSVPKQYETQIISKTGKTIPVEITAAKTLWLNQPASVASIRDISFRKKAEADLLVYQKQLQSFASGLTLTEEKERRKIANEIHNRLGQSLALSKIKISALQENIDSGTVYHSLQEIRVMIEKLIEETRTLTFELSPPVLYELGFEPAVEWLSEQFQNRYHISIQINDDGKEKPLDDDIRFILFDAVRELLINVMKHAKAKHVYINMRRENGFLQINVEDDGMGFDVSILKPGSAKKQGFGYFQIKERLKLLDGELNIKSIPDQGTNVSIRAPLK